jgi:Glycine-zipper domain
MKKAAALGALLLAACATPAPTGPGILVLPGTGKTFDQFRVDDQDCRGFAYNQIGGKAAEQASQDSATRSAVVGAAIGTAAGALIGGGEGAAVGAGVGLAGGSIVGSDASRATAGSQQQRYDHAFTQCMYAKGHKVPVAARYSSSASRGSTSNTQAARTPPPPPPPGKPPAEVPPDYKQQ